MILQKDITEWRSTAPWPRPDQIEHDLILSRAICELYLSPVVARDLVFRGGTALHKLFFEKAGRFSEDLDFVQTRAEPIGDTVRAVRDCLDSWLGKPEWKQNYGRFTLTYRFDTEIAPIVTRKIKIEINTREHFHLQPYLKKVFKVNSSWFEGESEVTTYMFEELLATKLRALYQRKKGRDLYDFWFVMQQQKDIDISAVIGMFKQYMAYSNITVSRAEFEKNLFLKKTDKIFDADIRSLLTVDQLGSYSSSEAYEILFNDFLSKMEGNSWKGI